MMLSEYLKKIVSSSQLECRKKADRILAAGGLIFMWNETGSLSAEFADSGRGSVSTEIDSSSETADCTCGEAECAHITAAAVHFLKYTGGTAGQSFSKPVFRGLKGGAASDPSPVCPEESATLEISMESAPPHAPSKWEKCVFNARLFWKGREYAGNMNNLRALNFGNGVGADLRISHFSPQERQIIRFLALSAEVDGKNLLLDAEMTAEFFHCLTGFRRCFIKRFPGFGKKSPKQKYSAAVEPAPDLCTEPFFVHQQSAEIVLNCRKAAGMIRLQPSVFADGALVPLKDFRMIAGRAGCWLGIASDYWWIPGTIDIYHLRGFLISAGGRYSGEEAEQVVSAAELENIRVVSSPSGVSVPTGKCIPVYDADFADDGAFSLRLSFMYGTVNCLPDGQNVIAAGKSALKRDRRSEKIFEAELLCMGFLKIRTRGASSEFILKNHESTGLFIDRAVAGWQNDKMARVYSAKFAKITYAGRGVPEFSLQCAVLPDDSGDTVDIRYILSAAGQTADWKELSALVRKERSFLFKESGIIGKIDKRLAGFIRATSDFIKTYKDNPGIMRIPKSTLVYWGEKYEELTGLMPDAVSSFMSEIGMPHEKSSEKSADSPKKTLFLGELRPYQAAGVDWIINMAKNGLHVILADEMGLGKTVQTIAVLCRYREENSDLQPSIILCPSSLVENWHVEFAKFAPEMKVLMLRGTGRKKDYDSISGRDVIIASYNIAGRDIDRLKKINFHFAVLDEAQHIKNPSTVNAATAKTLQTEHKLVLTGTPLENAPKELWSIFDFLHPRMLGSLNAFEKRYSGILKDESVQCDLAARTAPFILRRKKADVEPDLPDKVVQTLYCEMPPNQRKIYEECRRDGLIHFGKLLKSGKSSRFDLLTNLLRLRQICCHPSLVTGSGMPDIPSAKTELLQELLLESIDSGHKLLLFSQFTSLLAIIRVWLDDRDIPYEYLDGSTRDRLARVNKFNSDPDIPLFLLSLKAGGVGLNLTSADRVIIYDPWWNPAVEAQATDRTHRIGQKRSVYSMKLVVRDSIEEKILRLQKQKQKIFQNLVETPSASLKKLSDEDIEFLLT